MPVMLIRALLRKVENIHEHGGTKTQSRRQYVLMVRTGINSYTADNNSKIG